MPRAVRRVQEMADGRRLDVDRGVLPRVLPRVDLLGVPGHEPGHVFSQRMATAVKSRAGTPVRTREGGGVQPAAEDGPHEAEQPRVVERGAPRVLPQVHRVAEDGERRAVLGEKPGPARVQDHVGAVPDPRRGRHDRRRRDSRCRAPPPTRASARACSGDPVVRLTRTRPRSESATGSRTCPDGGVVEHADHDELARRDGPGDVVGTDGAPLDEGVGLPAACGSRRWCGGRRSRNASARAGPSGPDR